MGWFRSAPERRGDASSPDRLAQIGPGVPGHCPACDGLGYIESIDIGHRYQIQHCKDCLHRWEYLFDDDGTVVGLTELDPDGRPVTRSRVRVDRDTPAPVLAVDQPDGIAVVVDVRDQVVAPPPVLRLSEEEQLSPADWLRRSVDR